MEISKVDMFVLNNAKYFQHNQLMYVRERLIAMEESKWVYVQTLQFKDPTISLIISILVGALGIDRFLIGDTGLGIAKLLTCGGLGIWALVDWFLIMGRTKEKNWFQDWGSPDSVTRKSMAKTHWRYNSGSGRKADSVKSRYSRRNYSQWEQRFSNRNLDKNRNCKNRRLSD